MRRKGMPTRRQFVAGLTAGAALGLSACDRLSEPGKSRDVLDSAETLTRKAQRGILDARGALAPEFSEADISKVFKAKRLDRFRRSRLRRGQEGQFR